VTAQAPFAAAEALAASEPPAGGVLKDVFADVVERHPDRIAIDVPPSARRPVRRTVTYAELDRLANGVALAIHGAVDAPDRIVVVLLPRESEHVYAAQLGVLEAGAAFTCIDPAFPDGQVRTIVEDAEPAAVLTDAAGCERLARLGVRAPVIDVREVSPSHAPPARAAWLTPASLAYLIYTSGTTGRPKGVMIEHRSIVNLVRGDLATLGVTPADRVAQNSSSAYDSSIEETWFALGVGATLVVMDDETVRLGPDLPAWLRRERVTMFCPPPTMLRATGCADPARELPELRLLHPGGEALSQDIADRWSVGRRVVNDYGPTETTITALRAIVEPKKPVAIGTPVPGVQAWVLDENLQPVPDGTSGELCLGGVALARGYRNDAPLTAQKFPVHPELGRVYRTGDLVTRGADGCFYSHGRIDAQVKIRGYRIELEAVEARLAEISGVREAACAVQGEGARKVLVGFVVPERPGVTLDPEPLKARLAEVLPAYMVPAQIGTLAELPRNASNKLNRRALPALQIEAHGAPAPAEAPRTELETRVALAMQHALALPHAVGVHEDFFHDLGGDSFASAVLVSELREHADTASLTVRDVYEARTPAALAQRVAATHTVPDTEARMSRSAAPRPKGRPLLATLAQALWLLVGVLVLAPVVYEASFVLFPEVIDAVGPDLVVVLAPLVYLAGVVLYAFFTASLAVAVKRVLIGTYQPTRAPVWGGFYLRNWIVQRCVRLVPWGLIEATVFQQMLLRALGARIGARVHLHRGVTLLEGGWDLLTIGDDAAVGQDAALGLVALVDGQIAIGPVTLGARATVEARAAVEAGAMLGDGAELSAWSYLPAGHEIPDGERWDGVPALRAGRAQPPPVIDRSRDLSPTAHGLALIGGRMLLALFLALPVQVLIVATALVLRLDAATFLEWLYHPLTEARYWALEAAVIVLAVPGTLAFEALAMRLLGRLPPGAVSRFGTAYLRLRLKTETLESAGRWLCGTLLWPVWLRAAGMRIGGRSEIGTIIDTVPEMVEIGSETFFADGIYLAGPRIAHGTVTLAPVRIGDGAFFGNFALVGCGQTVADGVLLGVCTVADERAAQRDTSWFGHPPFALHAREPTDVDRSLTHEPGPLRYANRVLWELLRFGVPLLPLALLLAWFGVLDDLAARVSLPVLLLAVVPGLELALLVLPPLIVIVLKWLLLGRVRPGTHPLWSCWVSRWDFLYIAWDFWARAPLAAIEGTLLLNAFLRAMGVRLGRRVVLGPGFEQVADPDMLDFRDDTTVTALNQAHTFEDRVLKLDRVTVRANATVGRAALLLYGADIGENTYVAPQSAVMKGERLLPSRVYAGRPTRPVRSL
jgi:non-ribosomal peptide synthetase-like protein